MENGAEERDELLARAVELTKLLQNVGGLARERQAIFVRLRNEREMTYQAIGDLVGLSRQAVESICKGRGITDTPN